MDFVAENVPPQLQELDHVTVAVRGAHLAGGRIEIDQPRFHLANEVQDLHTLTESVSATQIRVAS